MAGVHGGADPGALPEPRWDVALSFASAQRDYVGQVAGTLKARGVRCFYDGDEVVELWGKDLAEEQLTAAETVAAFGDDTTAVLFYYPHTANVSDAPTAECFTVADGKITRSVLVFDRPSFAPPQR